MTHGRDNKNITFTRGFRQPVSSTKAIQEKEVKGEKGAAGRSARANEQIRTDLEFAQSKVDLGSLAPSQQIYTPDLVSVMEFIDAIVDRYAMLTELHTFIGAVAPSYVGFYLQMAFLIHIKKHGQLTGTSAGLVPVDYDTWAIPLAFAEFLEGFGPYEEDGSVHRMTLDHNTILQVVNPYWGFSDAATVLANRSQWPAGKQITIMYPANSGVDLFPVTTGLPFTAISESSFSNLVINSVSESIASSGLSYVSGTEIRDRAPTGAAYTYINQDVNSGAMSCYFVSPVDYWNPEIALIYNKHQALADANFYSSARAHSKKCVCMGTDDLNNSAPWYLQPMYTFIFIRSTASKFNHGPMNRIKYCKTPLKTLFPIAQRLDWRGFANLVVRHYGACYSSYPFSSATPVDANLRKLTAYIIICYMAMWARFTRAIPYFRNYFSTGSSFYTPQSFFASPIWQTVRLPAAIVDCISSVGPVVYRGRLYYPDFTVRVLNAQTYPGSPGPVWSMGTAGFISEALGSPSPFGFSLDFGVAGFPPTIGSMVIGQNANVIAQDVTTNVTLSLYSTPATAGIYPLFTYNYHAESLYRYFDTFHSNMSTNASMNKSLIHQHYEKCGATYIMLAKLSGAFRPTVAGTNQSFESVLDPDDISTASPTSTLAKMAMPLIEVNHIASLVQLGSGDLALCLAYAINVQIPPQAGVNTATLDDGKFVLKLPSSTNISLILENLMQASYMVGSTFVDAIGKREADYNDVMARGVITAVLPPDKDGCFIKSLFKTVARVLGNGLKIGVSVAAGAVCGMGVAAVGAPQLSTVAEGACSAGANKLMGYIGSRLGIDANDIDTPSRYSGTSPKDQADAVTRLVQKVKKNVMPKLV